jgi:hypothetical protein
MPGLTQEYTTQIINRSVPEIVVHIIDAKSKCQRTCDSQLPCTMKSTSTEVVSKEVFKPQFLKPANNFLLVSSRGYLILVPFYVCRLKILVGTKVWRV